MDRENRLTTLCWSWSRLEILPTLICYVNDLGVQFDSKLKRTTQANAAFVKYRSILILISGNFERFTVDILSLVYSAPVRLAFEHFPQA